MATTTLTPTAELFQQLACIADDEGSVKKVLRYVKRVVAKREEADKEKQELMNDLREAFHELKLYREGKTTFQTWEEVRDELRKEDACN